MTISETRVTSDTGGQKGAKQAAFDLIDQKFLWECAEVFGFGAAKYPDDPRQPNWRRGYDFALSIAALMRHISLFIIGEQLDTESGKHHLAHAFFHLQALFVFSTNKQYERFDTRIIQQCDNRNEKKDEQLQLELPEPLVDAAPPVRGPVRGCTIIKRETLSGHTIDYVTETAGYIDGNFLTGTNFTSPVALYRAGYQSVDEEIEAINAQEAALREHQTP